MKIELEKLKIALLRINPIIEEGLTIEETAASLNISTSSVDKALSFVRKNAILLPIIIPGVNPGEFVNNLNKVLRENTKKGLKVGEHNGGKVAKWTSEEALYVAHTFLAQGLTLRTAESIMGFPKSTIKEMFESEAVKSAPELYNDVKELLQINIILSNFDDSKQEKARYVNALNKRSSLLEKYQGQEKENGKGY